MTKAYTPHPCNLCILSLYESGKQLWVQSQPSNVLVIGWAMTPIQTILNSIT